jgi:beta-mannosidase
MNMLRVWGGGIYENDIFYELCDSYGIMVWQDFMFACALYPAEGALLESIRQEAIDNVKRLRNHPSIVVWCGNNECNMNLRSAKKKYEQRGTPEVFERMFRQYSDVYYKTLPEVVAELDPMRPYHPCSPFSGKGIPSKEAADPSKGDSHYWGVWHSKLPIDNYNTMRSRFFSEYGFQSFPEFESIKIYAPEERDWAVESEVMSAHQRGGTKANSRIRIYLENEYWPAKDFPSFVYINHVLQGDAIKTAMEAHRRDKPYCWGTIFWQHNDCWPVASWSSRDYYGRWKAQHYFTKYAYDDILVSAYNRDGRLKVYVVSDRLTSPKAELEVVIMDFNGNVVNKFVKSFKIAPNASTVIVDVATEEALGGAKAGDVFIASRLKVGERTYTNNNFFVKQNELNYPAANVTTKITEANDGFDVTLTTDNFARAVFMSIESVDGSVAGIDNFFSDNYFNLMPGSSRTIHVRTSLSAEEFAKQLRVVHLVQTK